MNVETRELQKQMMGPDRQLKFRFSVVVKSNGGGIKMNYVLAHPTFNPKTIDGRTSDAGTEPDSTSSTIRQTFL